MALMANHCPECGFINAEAANYCQKCGNFIGGIEGGEDGGASTSTDQVGETGEIEAIDLDAEVERTGAALVIRSGGGRAGESFPMEEDRIAIGRSPDAGVFLDDVTVSRYHAEILRHPGGDYTIRDLGSLNGTYVNRERIAEAPIANGDEVQIGKFRLVFLAAE